MKSINIESLFVKFIISQKYRWLRHLTLIGVILTISFDIILNNPKATLTYELLAKGTICYFLPFIILIYMHMHIGIKHYLLNQRYAAFSIFLTTGAVLNISILFLLLYYYLDIKSLIDISPYFLYINLIHSFMLMSMILVGITGIILFKHWIISSLRTDQLESENLQSELTYLSTQINPHFLFNMLNNAHVLIKEHQGNATPVLNKLEELLKYQITKSNKEKTLLSKEIKFIEDYLGLEKIRRDNFWFKISFPANKENIYITPLLFIPFVENAVKHSQDSENESFIEVNITIENNELTFICINSKPEDNEKQPYGGLGLKNIKRRLNLLYNKKYNLETEETNKQYKITLKFSLI